MEQSTAKSIEKNEEHYDQVYSNINVDSIVARVIDINNFLADAIQTDTSWHGLYQGNFANNISGKSVLEVGCGDGANALIMAALGANVVANDISTQSEVIIRNANSRLNLTNIKTMMGDLEQLPFEPASFDFIVGKAFLHHLTHELERSYLEKIARLLKPNGEARFFEPATNSQFVDKLRWLVPVPGRPSILQKTAFAEWKKRDPHPERDNSAEHFIRVGMELFGEVRITPVGSLERLCRLIPPKSPLNRPYRRWAHRIQPHLPFWLRHKAARSQLIVYRMPKNIASS